MESIGLEEKEKSTISKCRKNSREENKSTQVPLTKEELLDKYNKLSEEEKKTVGDFFKFLLDQNR
jgi:aromatic ring hydroxylase